MARSHTLQMPNLDDLNLEILDPRLLDALSSLNQIGAALNRLYLEQRQTDVPDVQAQIQATLRLIVESAIEVLPGASGVVYAYDPVQQRLDLDSRVSAGEDEGIPASDQPRPDGIGARAIEQQRYVISYEEADLDIHPVKVQSGARAMACFPLLVLDRVVGVLYVYLHQERRFSRFELLMLGNFCNQAAMAVYQARRLAEVQSDLERKEDELSRLRHAGMVISSRPELEETLEVILRMALEVTDAHYGIFRLTDKSGKNLVTRAFAGDEMDRPLVETLPVGGNSVMGRVAKDRRPILIPDLRAAPWNTLYYPLDADLEMRSELAVPLIGASGRLEGVLNLESPNIDAFSMQDSHLLQSLATQAVIAIQEVRLLDALQEVAELLLVQPCSEVLFHLVDVACDLLNAAASAIWTRDDGELVLQAASAGFERGDRLPLAGSLTGLAVSSGGPVTTSNIRKDPRFHRPDLAQAQAWDRALVVPLISSDSHEPFGAFSVYSTTSEPGRFADSVWDEKVLTCLAHYAALAVHNAARQDALRAAQEQRAVAEMFAAVGDVAANVLHHLNNKVGTIPVRVQGIEDKCRPALLADDYMARNLHEIEKSAAEAMRTVRESLSHLRPILLAPTSIAECVRASLSAADLAPGIEVDLVDLDDLPAVLAGRQSLALVFTNLLGNAADAMEGQGKITIEGLAHGDAVEVAVVDDGPGIAPELHERIFEFNYSGRNHGRTGKLGFGLWWVKTVMVRLGGSVSVASDGQNGSTFRLWLPRVTETT